MVDDEILQLNDQVVPGQHALKIMRYWKGLKAGSPQVYKVRRAGEIVLVTTK